MNETTAPITGDEVILAPNGRPWPTAKEADKALQLSNRDRNIFGTMMYEGGYAIATYRKICEVREKQMAERNANTESNRPLPPMKFYKVMINPKSGENESPTVLLSFNNNAFVLNRGMEAILDEPHMEVLRNASMEDIQPVTAQESSMNPERALKVGHALSYRFPFTILGQATKEEFELFIRHMNAETEKSLRQQQLKTTGATS